MKHLIVFRLSAMGDVAMTAPVIRAVVAQHPEVRITVVSRPFFKPFFDGIERVDFFPIDLNERHKGFLGLLRLYKDLKELNVDGFADLHNVIRSKVVRSLFSLSGKKTASLDKGRAEKKELTRFEEKTLRPLKTMHQRYADVFEQLGYKTYLSLASFPKKAILSDEVLAVTGEKSDKWVGVAPFAQYQSKVYPLDLMQAVIDKLAEQPNLKVLLFGGGEAEIKQLNTLKKNYPNVIVIAGRIKFQHELHLISNLDMMLSMDSGNAHIAAMYGVRTLVLFGATHPYLGFMPFRQPLEYALLPDLEKYPKLPTSVYGNKLIDSYQDAMRSISSQSVVDKIKSVLA